MNAQTLLQAFRDIDSELLEEADTLRISAQNKGNRKKVFLRISAGLTAAVACCGIVWATVQVMPDGLTEPSGCAQQSAVLEETPAENRFIAAECIYTTAAGSPHYCYDAPMQVLRDTFADLIGNCTFSAVTEEARDDYCENIRHAVCLRFEPTDVTIRCKHGTQTVRDFNSVNISLAESDHIDLMCGGESQFWRLTFAESDGHALALAADAAADAADDEYYWWYQTGAIESLGNHILFANDFFAANHDITAFGFDPAQRTACSLPLSCSTGAENADTQLLRAKRYLNTLLRLPFITATEKPLNMEDGMRCCTEIRFDAPQSFTLHNILEGDIQIRDAAALWIKPADTNEILYDLSRKDAAALRYDLYVLHEDDLKRDTGLLRECYTLDNRASEDMFLEEDLYYCFIKLFYPLK